MSTPRVRGRFHPIAMIYFSVIWMLIMLADADAMDIDEKPSAARFKGIFDADLLTHRDHMAVESPYSADGFSADLLRTSNIPCESYSACLVKNLDLACDLLDFGFHRLGLDSEAPL